MRKIKVILFIFVMTCSSLLFVSPAKAWRETGHFSVCEIAYRHLNKKAKSRVDQIVGANFAAQCTWPDLIRKHPDYEHTFSWHFLDRNDDVDYLAEAKVKDKKFAAGDALQALMRVTKTLKNPASTPEENKFALRFLGHIAGDLHQPLHVGHEDDGGGNQVKIEWFGQSTYKYSEIQMYQEKFKDLGEVYIDEATGEKVVKMTEEKPAAISLHKVWDLHLIEKFIELNKLPIGTGYNQYSYKEYSSKIDQGQVPTKTIKLLQNSTYYDWFFESKYFRNYSYNTGGDKLGQDYYDKVIEVANYRMLIGGLRLAGELNRIFGGVATPADLKPNQVLLEDIVAAAQVSDKTVAFTPEMVAKFADGEKKLKLNGITKQLCSDKDFQVVYSKKEKTGRKPAAFYEDYKTFQRDLYLKLAGKGFSKSTCKR